MSDIAGSWPYFLAVKGKNTNHQQQLHLYQFCFLVYVSALVKIHYQANKNT
jgi:hypothetical protein